MAATFFGSVWVPSIGAYLVFLAPRTTSVVTEGNEAQGNGAGPSQPLAPSQWGPGNAALLTFGTSGAGRLNPGGIYYGPDHSIAWSGRPFVGNSPPGREVPPSPEDPLQAAQVTAGGAGSGHVQAPGGELSRPEVVYFGAQPAGGAVAPPGEVQLQLTSLLDQSASPGAESVRATAGRGRPDGAPTLFRLTLLGRGKARAVGSSLTLFLPGEARRCSEVALLAAYREEGSPQAFNALVERYRSAVLRSCYRVLGSWHDAEDVSQMVFLALAQGKMRLHSTLSGWLSAVARNASLVLLRSRRRRRRHEQQAAQPLSATYEEFTAALLAPGSSGRPQPADQFRRPHGGGLPPPSDW